MTLDAPQKQRLIAFAQRLIDQTSATTIVPPQRPGTGHWFGGGNMVQDAAGKLWLVGRFRNHGDSRTGLGMGERGLELAVFGSDDQGKNWRKEVSFSKSDLDVGEHKVLSIEGTALRLTESGVELYLSTEKSGISYPSEVRDFLKPGTGVWTIDRIVADSVAGLAGLSPQTILSSDDPRFVQVKDPFLYKARDQTHLMYCTHPFCWSSSNTGYVPLSAESKIADSPNNDFFPRGFTWDVAMTRGTAILDVPNVGQFADTNASLFFYDGGECVRDLDQHKSAVTRPRGYSCEELGGLACLTDHDFSSIERLSVNAPMFVSPHGTGCSRYVDVLATEDGFYATWQQSQDDHSQPLVMNFVSATEAAELLS